MNKILAVLGLVILADCGGSMSPVIQPYTGFLHVRTAQQADFATVATTDSTLDVNVSVKDSVDTMPLLVTVNYTVTLDSVGKAKFDSIYLADSISGQDPRDTTDICLFLGDTFWMAHYVGASMQMNSTIKDQDGAPVVGTIQWSTDDGITLLVTPDGRVIPHCREPITISGKVAVAAELVDENGKGYPNRVYGQMAVAPHKQ